MERAGLEAGRGHESGNVSRSIMGSFFKEAVILSVVGLSVAMVDKFDRGAAWLYAGVLLVGYAMFNPAKLSTFTGFFNQIINVGGTSGATGSGVAK